jgi:hypothetical protein
MTMTSSSGPIRLKASFGGVDTTGILNGVQHAGWCRRDSPRVEVDHAPSTLSLEQALAGGSTYIQAIFEPRGRLWIDPGAYVNFDFMDVERLDVPQVLEVLAELPFEIASFGSLYLWEGYQRPGWGDGHQSLGWGAAFKGRGHERLASRHWLEGGPFKVWRGANDVSLVQFHALDADEKSALEQAQPGHRQFGNFSDETGFLQSRFVYTLDLNGLYVPETKTLKVIVLGRAIPNLELLEWAATRVVGRGDYLAGAIERVAYIFPDEAEGRAALPRLWRYGHECWVIRDGEELRLDDTYTPPDATPSWAR